VTRVASGSSRAPVGYARGVSGFYVRSISMARGFDAWPWTLARKPCASTAERGGHFQLRLTGALSDDANRLDFRWPARTGRDAEEGPNYYIIAEFAARLPSGVYLDSPVQSHTSSLVIGNFWCASRAFLPGAAAEFPLGSSRVTRLRRWICGRGFFLTDVGH
jgi:hypothetical protein